MTQIIGLLLAIGMQDLDEAEKAMEKAREAVRAGRAAEPEPGPVALAPALPPTGPVFAEIYDAEYRRRFRERQDHAEALKLIAEARIRRADHLSMLYATAARPVELPILMEALPPAVDFATYPLYIPVRPLPPGALASGTRLDAADHRRHVQDHIVACERAGLEAWTSARRAAVAPDADFEDRWGDRVLEIRRDLAGRR